MTTDDIKALRDYSEGPTGYWDPIIQRVCDEVERLRAELEREAADHRQANEDAAQMMAERDAALPDAERYRWLRDPSNDGASLMDDWDMYSGVDFGLDAAIDAARKDTP